MRADGVADSELWVRAAGGDLPRRYQEVLELCAWSELTYQEAATVLDIPVGTIRSRLARARARMAELDGNPRPPTDTDGVKLIRASRKVEEEQ